MTAGAKQKSMTGVPLEPHVRAALADARDDLSLVERAALAWGAEHQAKSDRALMALLTKIGRLFNLEADRFSNDWFDRANPVECAGAIVEDVVFGFRGNPGQEALSAVYVCAHEGCTQEVYGPVNGIVELGRVVSLIEDQKEPGEPWKCQQHRKGTVV